MKTSCRLTKMIQKKHNWLVDFLIDFFDPTVAIQMAQICVRLRENRGRAILNFMFFVMLIVLGPAFAESEHEFNYTRLRFNWDGIDYINFATYTSTLGFIMFAVVMLLKKWLKFSDMFICIVSSTMGCVARFLYVIFLFRFRPTTNNPSKLFSDQHCHINDVLYRPDC